MLNITGLKVVNDIRHYFQGMPTGVEPITGLKEIIEVCCRFIQVVQVEPITGLKV